MATHSILSAARTEGYRAGWSEAMELGFDDAVYNAVQEADARHSRERKRWWLFGVACGVSATVLLGAFF